MPRVRPAAPPVWLQSQFSSSRSPSTTCSTIKSLSACFVNTRRAFSTDRLRRIFQPPAGEKIMSERNQQWPSLPLEEWLDTCSTLHLWSQIVGKIRMELGPWVNHSWGVTLYVTS